MNVRGGKVEVWIRMNSSFFLQDVLNWVGWVCDARSALASAGVRSYAVEVEPRSFMKGWLYNFAYIVLHEPDFVNWESELVSGTPLPLPGGLIPQPHHWHGVGEGVRKRAQVYFLIHYTP